MGKKSWTTVVGCVNDWNHFDEEHANDSQIGEVVCTFLLYNTNLDRGAIINQKLHLSNHQN